MGDFMTSLGIGGANAVGGLIGAGVQHRRQKKLMGLQYKNQLGLNTHGQQMQMKTWEDTNYGPQMEQMRKAGLNPALMYGMSGGGGTTTGAQTGGSATGGSASAPKMDIGAGVAQGALLKAQKDNLDANTNKTNVEADSIGGVKGTIGASQIAKLIAETGTEQEKQGLIKAQKAVEEAKEGLVKAQEGTEGKKQENLEEDTRLKTKTIDVQEQEKLLKKYEVELNKLGIQKTDNKIFRYLTKKASEIGITLESLLDKMKF